MQLEKGKKKLSTYAGDTFNIKKNLNFREGPISSQFPNEFLCIFRRSFEIYLEIGVAKDFVQKEFLLNLPLWLLMKLKAMEQKCWLWKCRTVQVVSLCSLYCFVNELKWNHYPICNSIPNSISRRCWRNQTPCSWWTCSNYG